MRSALPLLAALLLTASTCDPEPHPSPVWGEAPTDVCATEPVIGLVACPLEADFPYGEELTGSWSAWQPGEVEFDTTDDRGFRIDLAGGPEAFYGLPDLADEGELELVIEGFCDLDSGPSTALLAWSSGQRPEDPGALLMLAGNTEAAAAAGWTVQAPADDDACPDPQDCDCWDGCRSKPVLFDGPDGPARLYQREETVRGELVLRVAEAWSGTGATSCDGPRENQVWMVFRP